MKSKDFIKWIEDNPNSNIAEEFGKRMAQAILELKSSHAYFILQMACGEIFWEEAEEILKKVINNDKIDMSDKVYGIGIKDNNGFGMTHGMVWDIKDMLAVIGEENSCIVEFCNGDWEVLYKWDEVSLEWIPFKKGGEM